MMFILNAEKVKAINPFMTEIRAGLFVCVTSGDGDLIIVELEKYLAKWLRSGKTIQCAKREIDMITTPLGEEPEEG